MGKKWVLLRNLLEMVAAREEEDGGIIREGRKSIGRKHCNSCIKLPTTTTTTITATSFQP
jgi:hypothetical protein